MSFIDPGLFLRARRKGFYEIDAAIEFKAASNQYLTRTFGAGGNRKKFGLRMLVRRATLGAYQTLFSCTNGFFCFYYSAGAPDAIYWQTVNGVDCYTAAQYRDTASFYDILLVFDSAQADAANRQKLYVNGVQQTITGTISQNADATAFNNNVVHELGRWNTQAGRHFDGVFADVCFIDNAAPLPTEFGEFDANGKWHPKKYGGSYGVTGFHLDFANSGSLGADVSGNGNTWTPVNAPVQTLDTPTNLFARLIAGFYPAYASYGTVTNAGTRVISSNDNPNCVPFAVPVGVKAYWEARAISGVFTYLGIVENPNLSVAQPIALTSTGTNIGKAYKSDGTKVTNFPAAYTSAAYGAAIATNDVVGILIDRVNHELRFTKNGVDQGKAFDLSPTAIIVPLVYGLTQTGDINFGDKAFWQTPPSGFKSLCTKNLPAPPIADPGKHFDIQLWTGNSANRTILTETKPGLVWIKTRANAVSHFWFDVLRGATNWLKSDNYQAETSTADTLTAFRDDGFDLGVDAVQSGVNYSGRTEVGWIWGGFTDMTAPEIASLVTATGATITPTAITRNVEAGWAAIAYTGNGAAGATLPNPLGADLGFMIAKNRDSAAFQWLAWHLALTGANTLYLSAASAQDTQAHWGARPNADIITLNGLANNNGNGNRHILYVFAPVYGFSAFGSYVGNAAADGPRVILPFRPAFVMTKCVTSTSDWWMLDDTRDPYNPLDDQLYANLANATSVAACLDMLANGFKVRSSGAGINAAQTFIYAAFARHPFGGGSVAPVPAR
jgi:hypothetical protein